MLCEQHRMYLRLHSGWKEGKPPGHGLWKGSAEVLDKCGHQQVS